MATTQWPLPLFQWPLPLPQWPLPTIPMASATTPMASATTHYSTTPMASATTPWPLKHFCHYHLVQVLESQPLLEDHHDMKIMHLISLHQMMDGHRKKSRNVR
jgi:hypothetical protein